MSCPDRHLVSGIGLIMDNRVRNLDFLPFVGLNVSCSSYSGRSSSFLITAPDIPDHVLGQTLSPTAHQICTPSLQSLSDFGLVAGLEVKSLEVQSSLRIIDVATYCYYPLSNERTERKQAQVTLRNALVSNGRWHLPQFCPWGKHVCAFKIKYGRCTRVQRCCGDKKS